MSLEELDKKLEEMDKVLLQDESKEKLIEIIISLKQEIQFLKKDYRIGEYKNERKN